MKSLNKLFSLIRPQLLYLAWLVAIASMAGSLFFSEVMHLPPCVLCWYQRICMYPLVLLLPLGIALEDTKIRFYGLSLSVVGLVIAFYHCLLYYKVLPEAIIPCSNGVSCTIRLIEWFGFITIPLLSFAAFLFITLALWFYKPASTSKSE